MKNILTNININKASFIFNIILLIILPLLLLGLTFFQLIPILIFFIYILLIFISINKESLKRIRYVFIVGILILIIFLILAINSAKSPGLDFIGGLAIFLVIVPIFIVGLIGLVLSFIIGSFYNFWIKWKFKYLLTILIVVIFVVSLPFTYQYALINFYFGNYNDMLCERHNKFVIGECIENLAILSNNIDFCNNPNIIKNTCLYDIALKNNNLRACESITNLDVKERCYKNIDK